MNRFITVAVLMANAFVCGCESQSDRLAGEAANNKKEGELIDLMVKLGAILDTWENENPAPYEDAGRMPGWEKERLEFVQSEHGELYRRYETLRKELGVESTNLFGDKLSGSE